MKTGLLICAVCTVFLSGCGKSVVSGQIFVTKEDGTVQKVAGAEVMIMTEKQASDAVRRADEAYEGKVEELYPSIHPLLDGYRRASHENTRASRAWKDAADALEKARAEFDAAKLKFGGSPSPSDFLDTNGAISIQAYTTASEQWKKDTKRDELSALELSVAEARSYLENGMKPHRENIQAYTMAERAGNDEVFRAVVAAFQNGGAHARCRTDADGKFSAECPNGRVAIVAATSSGVCWTLWVGVPATTNIVISDGNGLRRSGRDAVYEFRRPSW